MRSGMTMDANLIVISRREGALLLPNRALQGDRVLLPTQGRLKRRSVVRGAVGADRTEIVSGITDGETVVLSPSDALRDGQRARCFPSPSGRACRGCAGQSVTSSTSPSTSRWRT